MTELEKQRFIEEKKRQIVEQIKSMFLNTYTMSQGMIETFNKVSPAPLNVTSTYPAICMYFVSKVMGINVSSEELAFLSSFFSSNINQEALEFCSYQDSAWESFFDISCSLDSRLKQLDSSATCTAKCYFSFFELFGQLLLDRFGTMKRLETYNRLMSDLCRLINQKDTALTVPMVYQRYVLRSSTAPAQTPTPSVQRPQISNTPSQQSYEKSINELNQLIGLQSIKRDVSELIGLAKMMKMREEKGMKSIPVSLHLVFTGNPGTGKTTVARILAELYKEIGILKKGQLVEVDRSELVAGYVGQTAIKTQEKINEAIGGILFIDEAYTLAKEGNDFGQEAIDTILKEMEDRRGEFIVIVAGYSEPMKRFIESNPGLKSRFNKYFEFPDYNAEELIQIFCSMCSQYDYSIDDNALDAVKSRIRQMESQKDANFANARDIRNMFERIITKQSNRVAFMEKTTDADLTTITLQDVE